MEINKELLDNLSEQAKDNPRLRMNYDLRTSAEDTSQRMLNAIEPDSIVPIHRHPNTTETVVVIRGIVRQNFYDDNGELLESFEISANSSVPIYVVPQNRWHNTESLESGTIIFEAKDGAYTTPNPADFLVK